MTLTLLEDQLFFFFNHPLTAPTSKVPVFLEEGGVGERNRMAVEGGPGNLLPSSSATF